MTLSSKLLMKAKDVKFELFSPTAKDVFLAGTFNDWNPNTFRLKKDKEGGWKTTLKLGPGRYEYLFIVDGTWECDPKPQECVPNPFGSWNCVRTVE